MTPNTTLRGDELVAAARELATRAHEGQVDKLGVAYIEHPAAVASLVADWGYGPAEQAVAWLHDVVEDSPVTLDELRQAGFPEAVVVGVGALTRGLNGPETHEQAVLRAKADPLGRPVKTADMTHNGDPARLAAIEDEPTRTRLAAKYAHGLELIATE